MLVGADIAADELREESLAGMAGTESDPVVAASFVVASAASVSRESAIMSPDAGNEEGIGA